MYQNIVYDFDGTISDTYPIFTKALLVQLERHGMKGDYEECYALLKISVGEALRHFDWGNFSREEIKREFHEIHDAMAMEEQKPYDDAEEVLRYAVEQGKKNYLYTHTDTLAYRLLEKWGLRHYFTDAIDGSMTFPRKPAPDALLYLMEKNGMDPAQTLMVGDRDIDIDAGHNAGTAGCLYDYEGFYSNTGAEHDIHKLIELKNII
jgi:HAD superfamily hydrolase (TIGR01549 family)